MVLAQSACAILAAGELGEAEATLERMRECLKPFGLSSRRLGNICRKTLEAGIEVDTDKAVVKRFRLCPFDAKTVSDLWPWPDTDGDRAVQNLNTTLHRLRKLLGSDKAVVLSNGQLHSDSRFCWIDARHFAWLAQQIDIPPPSPIKKEYLARALRMYRIP